MPRPCTYLSLLVLVSLLMSSCGDFDSPSPASAKADLSGIRVSQDLWCGALTNDDLARNSLIKMVYAETMHPTIADVNVDEAKAITLVVINRALSSQYVDEASNGQDLRSASIGARVMAILLAHDENGMYQFTPAGSPKYSGWFTDGSTTLAGHIGDEALSKHYTDIVCGTIKDYDSVKSSLGLHGFCSYAANYAINPCGTGGNAQSSSRDFKRGGDCSMMGEEQCNMQGDTCFWNSDAWACKDYFTIFYSCSYDWGYGRSNPCSLDLDSTGNGEVAVSLPDSSGSQVVPQSESSTDVQPADEQQALASSDRLGGTCDVPLAQSASNPDLVCSRDCGNTWRSLSNPGRCYDPNGNPVN